MMASNLISRLLPTRTGSPSVYETIRQHDELSDHSEDVEERAGMALDEENLGERFHDYELEDALAQASESQIATQGTALPAKGDRRQQARANGSKKHGEGRKHLLRPKWMQGSPRVHEADDADDEVPASLLIEGGDEGETQKPPEPPLVGISNEEAGIPVPGSLTQGTRQRWEKAQAQQKLHHDRAPSPSIPRPLAKGPKGLAFVDPKEKAMWRWANVDNLDLFLRDVYTYFLGNGFWSIMLARGLNLLTLAFVVGFTTFLTHCINYRNIPDGRGMQDILVEQCTKKMSGKFSFLLWLFTFFWIWKAFQYLMEVRKLRHMHDFYYHLLRISDNDIQTISWQEIVSRLMELRDSNPATADGTNAVHRRFIGNQSKQRMDAHDIANRLMRKENYLIALFNKDILDVTLPIPFLRKRQLFSRTLEWNIHLCILDYVFNEQGQVRPLFLKDTHRRVLSEGLRKRFIFAGFMNIFAAPFIVTYFLMHYFLRYFTEYQKNPAEIGSRQYNPLAEWKFREFNELWHLFQRRINMSYPFATRYVDQFPKDKTIQAARFVMFVSGALIAILAIGSMLDPQLFLNFEITEGRTVLFYLGLFGAIWAVARGIVPEENLVFDPEFALREVTDFTHYRPAHWHGRLHSDEVRKEFAMLYQLKVVIFLEEILSMITTPFVLWFSLPKCSDRLIDFFREFTVHVDGIGYVCSFAVFDFKKGGNVTLQGRNQQGGSGDDLRDDYFSTKDGKMLASYYGFMDNYATNPKPGAPYMHRSPRRRFHPPPSFHELASPPFPAEMGGTGSGMHDRWADRKPHSAIRPLPGPAFGHQSAHRTPRFGAMTQNSPLPSMLLDPHHQPSTSGFRSLSRPNTQSRYRPSRHPMANTIEDEDEEEEPTTLAQDAGGAETAEGPVDESNLGESWKTTRAGAVDDEEDEDDGQAAGGEKGAGVLGLIYQFQKAQTDGRGAGAVGVNI